MEGRYANTLKIRQSFQLFYDDGAIFYNPYH
jgi:hypothetical protein